MIVLPVPTTCVNFELFGDFFEISSLFRITTQKNSSNNARKSPEKHLDFVWYRIICTMIGPHLLCEKMFKEKKKIKRQNASRQASNVKRSLLRSEFKIFNIIL